jgi:hypothetical protein
VTAADGSRIPGGVLADAELLRDPCGLAVRCRPRPHGQSQHEVREQEEGGP